MCCLSISLSPILHFLSLLGKAPQVGLNECARLRLPTANNPLSCCGKRQQKSGCLVIK